MTIGTNTSPLVGKVKGHKLTARMVKDRLDRELVGNVSLKVVDIGRPDAWEVQGRGELALAILVEQMRREGFELTVGKPQVVTQRVENGKLQEPFEHMTIDAPEEYLGAITQLHGRPQGPHGEHGEPRHRLGPHGVHRPVARPDRLPHRVPHRHARHRHRQRASRTATTRGPARSRPATTARSSPTAPASSRPFAIIDLQERMTFFVKPTEEVYEGMVIGENSRADDMDVNITKEKKLTNMRQSTSDNFESMTPSRQLSLEECLEFAREDECVEVTPDAVRIRKVELDASARQRSTARLKKQNA